MNDFHFGMDDFDDDINVHNVEEADKPDEEVDRSTDKGDGVEVEHHKTAEDEYSSSRGADGSRHGNGCSVSDGENEMPTLKPMVRNVDDEIDLTQESSEGSEAGDVDARGGGVMAPDIDGPDDILEEDIQVPVPEISQVKESMTMFFLIAFQSLRCIFLPSDIVNTLFTEDCVSSF